MQSTIWFIEKSTQNIILSNNGAHMNQSIWTFLAAVGVSTIHTPAMAAPPAVGTISSFTGSLANTVCSQPEGIALDPQGNFYTASDRDGDTTGTICVFRGNGTFKSTLLVPAGPSGVVALLGMLFEEPRTLFALDIADGGGTNGRLLSIDIFTGAVRTLASDFSFPNAIAEDSHDNLYVSDSVQGTITRVAQDGTRKTLWSASSLLLAAATATPPLGANGVAFDKTFKNLYVANTGNDQIIRIPLLSNGNAGTAQVFADGSAINLAQHTTHALDGADGIAFDVDGNVYVASNQNNEIQVLSPAAHLLARYTNESLDFPASFVFRGNQLFFTNASLFDGGAGSAIFVLQTARPGAPLP
jgi:sugar lactone lactonase YvrE